MKISLYTKVIKQEFYYSQPKNNNYLWLSNNYSYLHYQKNKYIIPIVQSSRDGYT